MSNEETSGPILKHVIAALVANEPGVLSNVAGMFAARGFNIDSLVVGRTENPELSRMTIVVSGTMDTLDQVRKQLLRLVQVVKVVDYVGTDYVERDLMLVRVSAEPGKRREVIELSDMFRARIVDVGREELMIELSGKEEKLEAFVDLLQPYGIIELARTGLIAMPRSEKVEGKTPVRRATTAGAGISGPSTTAKSDVDLKDLPPG
ncbi:acetolactate synthase small subunit [Planctomycetales bacterium ZRK34]|nr:acetolactate synthase small subunit [Planctomycetales bacterium ZRK34]